MAVIVLNKYNTCALQCGILDGLDLLPLFGLASEKTSRCHANCTINAYVALIRHGLRFFDHGQNAGQRASSHVHLHENVACHRAQVGPWIAKNYSVTHFPLSIVLEFLI
jgi:hypothetical protein